MAPAREWRAGKELVALKGTLVCPACRRPFKDNHIFQCRSGHLFCKECDKGRCVTCKRHKGLIRNRPLEHISANTTILAAIGTTSDPSHPSGTPSATATKCHHCDARNLQVWYQALSGSSETFCVKCSKRKLGSQAALRLTPVMDSTLVAQVIQKYADTKQGKKRVASSEKRKAKKIRLC